MTPAFKLAAAALIGLAVLLLAGCETVRFGLDLANAETTVSFRHGDGKTVIEAEQDGSKVGINYRR